MNQVKEVYEKKFNHEWKSEQMVGAYDLGWLYLQKYAKDKHAKILDVGCGTGQYSRTLLANGFTNLYAVDLFEQPPFEYKGFHYIQAGMEELPFEKNSFDFVFGQSVIYYATDSEKVVLELKRVLKNGGMLYLSGHAKYSIYTWIRRMKLALKQKSVEHLQGAKFYPTTYYKKLLERHGFMILKRDGWGMCLFDIGFRCFSVLASLLHISYSDPRKRICHSENWCRFKSIVGYHFVIMAQKKEE